MTLIILLSVKEILAVHKRIIHMVWTANYTILKNRSHSLWIIFFYQNSRKTIINDNKLLDKQTLNGWHSNSNSK